MLFKLENLMKVTKNYRLGDAFLLAKDCPGWSDGFIADITGFGTEIMKAKAVLRGKKITRLKLNAEDGVEVMRVKPSGDKDEVINVEYNLNNNSAILIGTHHRAAVNPVYLKYFHTMYKELGGIKKIVLTGDDFDSEYMAPGFTLKAVEVYVGDSLTGFVMPIRVTEDQL